MRTTLWPLVVPLAMGCGADGVDGSENSPPIVAITSPADGSGFVDGQVVTVTVEVSDPDEVDFSTLVLAWSGSASTGELPQRAAPNGVVTLDLTPPPGEYELTVSVADPEGALDAATVTFTVAPDADGDGYGAPADCDDNEASVYPGAVEICNGVDDDCANGPDDGLVFAEWYTDADGDGYGDPSSEIASCEDLSATNVLDGTDCDDTSAALNRDDADLDGTDSCGGDCDDQNVSVEPGAPETCNGVDDDCVNGVDDGFATTDWYADTDHDGYGDGNALVATCLDLSATHVLDATDCDDNSSTLNHDDADSDGVDSCAGDCADLDALVLPGAAEICNGVDDNCVGGIDEGLGTTDWYIDADVDGYGDPLSLLSSCLDLSGTRVLDGTDCDDTDAGLNGDDVDVDGVTSCGGDCDDLDVLVNPGAEEICDAGIDNDCDPTTIETAMVAGVGYSSLADAVTAVPDGGTVELCPGVLPADQPVNVTKVVTIVGAGPERASTTLDGADAPNNTLFVVSPTGELHLQTLTIANAPAGAVRGTGGGGVIFADDVLFVDNSASGNGAAISGRTVTVTNSAFTGNSAASGGAIYVSAGGLLTVTDSSFDGNSALLDGGAFYTASPAVFTRVDVIGNTALGSGVNGGGGGVVAAQGSSATFAETFFSGNTAINGGALWVLGTSVDATTTTFDGNVADSAGTAYGGAVWLQANGAAVTWTGGEFYGNVSDAAGFAAGGGIVLDANDVGAALGEIVASWMVLDGNSTVGPAAANTGGGIWTSGAPITILDTVTMNNISDYGGGTSFNTGGGGVVTLERVEYRGNQGVHAGATDVYDVSVEMTDCIIEENVGGVYLGVQYGALLVDLNGDLTVTTSDLGVDAEDNDPFDVLVNAGPLPTYDYGDAASFFCDSATGDCT